jgi:hypothetical protein
MQDQVGLSLVHLLGDTETLAQTQLPQPVTLQELCDQNKVSASVRWVLRLQQLLCTWNGPSWTVDWQQLFGIFEVVGWGAVAWLLRMRCLIMFNRL